jgi:hypothetical protein
MTTKMGKSDFFHDSRIPDISTSVFLFLSGKSSAVQALRKKKGNPFSRASLGFAALKHEERCVKEDFSMDHISSFDLFFSFFTFLPKPKSPLLYSYKHSLSTLFTS